MLMFNQKKLINDKLSLFNYISLVSFKYYLTRRANNVLWVKTRYVKNNYRKESKVGYNLYNQGTYYSNFFITY